MNYDGCCSSLMEKLVMMLQRIIERAEVGMTVNRDPLLKLLNTDRVAWEYLVVFFVD